MTTARFLAELRPFVRRHTHVRTVRASLAAGVVAAGLIPVLGLAGLSTQAAAAAAAAAVAIAAAVAGSRRPPLQEIAAAIDKRHGLHSRVATALENGSAADVFASLVRRDAAAHLAPLVPSATFPMELPRHFTRTAAGALLVALLVTVSRPLLPGEDASARTGGAGGGRGTPGAGDTLAAAPSDETTPPDVTPPDKRDAVRVAARTGLDGASGPSSTGTAAAARPAPNGGGPTRAPAGDAARQHSTSQPPLAEGIAPGSGAATPPARSGATSSGSGGVQFSAPPGDAFQRSGNRSERRETSRILLTPSSGGADHGPLPPALRAYVLRYFDAIKR